MAKLKIYTFPDQVLAQKAKPIARVEKSYFKIADDMLETMYAAPGVGLAANQVGLLERILVIDVDYEPVEDDDKDSEGAEVVGGVTIRHRKPIIVINPEIVHKEGATSIAEGCLSVPEFTAEVKRSKVVTIKYRDIDGVEKLLTGEDFLAVAIQHEMDHLDGKLFIDRLSPLKKEMVRKRLKQDRELRELEEQMHGPLPPKKSGKGF